MIRRKTISVRADGVQAQFLNNISSIQESVTKFQEMAADSGNDVIMQYQSQKENYEREIEKLAARVEKQTQQDKELKQALAALQAEVEQYEHEKTQYEEQLEIVVSETLQLEKKISKSSVKEHEIVVVSALIEEKVALAEAKTQLKKNCKMEKQRLDEELARIKARREKLEQDEQNEALKQIDEEFEQQNSRLVEQKKLLAD